MLRNSRPSESGSILLAAILLTLLLFSLVAATVMVSNAEAKAVSESEETHAAFFFAESGVEAAKYEINENVDPDGNGIGNADGVSYSARAKSIGNSLWEVRSTGTFGDRIVMLETVLQQEYKSVFPDGAISIVGTFDRSKIKIKKHASLILDGGRSAALSFQDADTFARVAEDIANAFKNGDLPKVNITGRHNQPFEITKGKFAGEVVDLPIIHEPEPSEDLADLHTLYDQMVNNLTNEILPRATTINSFAGDNVSFGSEEAPVLVYLSGKKARAKGQSISGHGTLIVNQLILEKGAQLNWTGNVFVVGSSKSRARLDIKDAGTNFSLDGNLVVLGEGRENAEVRIHKGELQIDGSLLLLTNWSERSKTKAKLEVKHDGRLSVDGVVTMLGRKTEMRLHEDSSTTIQGILQIAAPSDGKKTEVVLEIHGNVEIYKDDARISNALRKWDGLERTLSLTEVDRLVEQDVSTVSWSRVK